MVDFPLVGLEKGKSLTWTFKPEPGRCENSCTVQGRTINAKQIVLWFYVMILLAGMITKVEMLIIMLCILYFICTAPLSQKNILLIQIFLYFISSFILSLLSFPFSAVQKRECSAYVTTFLWGHIGNRRNDNHQTVIIFTATHSQDKANT